MRRFKDLSGLRFGRWTVLRCVGTRKGSRTHLWLCRCDCGAERVVGGNSLSSGATQSCGCLQREAAKKANTKHGACRTLTYKIWTGMLGRCLNPKTTEYPRYGGRGITVCGRWRKFENFLADMGERPEGKSLDRYPDNNGNYEPGNVRWATRAEQGGNTSQNVWIGFRGERKTVVQWARELGIRETVLRGRLQRGWPPEKAMIFYGGIK